MLHISRCRYFYAALALNIVLAPAARVFAADAPLREQVRFAVQPVLLAARPLVINSATTLSEVEKRLPTINAIGQRVRNNRRTADEQSNRAAAAISTTSAALTDSQLKSVSTAAAVALHASLRDQSATFKDQALNTAAPSYVGGDPTSSLRPAMSRAIGAEDKYLGLYQSILANTDTWLADLEKEITELANGRNSRAISFGFDHYLTSLLQRADSQKLTLRGILPLLTGFDENGRSVTLSRPCASQNEPAYRPLSAEVDYLINYALDPANNFSSSDPSELTWSILIEQAIASYNALPSNGKTGAVARWQSCIDSKANTISALSTSIESEIQRGNLLLARNLDLQRSQLSAEVTVLKGELAVIQHRASQMQNFSDAVKPQALTANLATYPNAWRKTVQALGTNLHAIASVFPKLSQASSGLIKDVEAELSSLSGLTDEVKIREKASLVASRLQAIKNKGFTTLLSHIASGRESFAIITAGSDSSSLTAALNSYTATTSTKAAFWSGEPARNEAEIARSRVDYDAAVTTFADSQKHLAEANQREVVFNDQAKVINDLLKVYQTRFARDRFGSLYSGILNDLLARTKADASVAKREILFQNTLRSVAASFRGLENTPAGKKVTIRDKGALALRKQQEAMRPGVAGTIESVSLSLAGISLSELANRLKQAADAISAL